MKREKWLNFLVATAFAFVLSFSGAACLITGFALEHVSVGSVLVWCGLCSVIFSFCYTLKLQLIPVAVLALAAGYFWRQGSLYESVMGLTYALTRIYSMAYGWPVISGFLEEPETAELTMAVCTAATLSAFFVSRTVCGRKRVVLAVLAAVLPLAVCLVVTDKVPDTVWLFLFLLGMGLLILTQTLRRKSPGQANRLTVMALIPMLILSAVLFLAVPRDSYQNQELGAQLVASMKDWFENLTGTADPGGPVRADGGAVDLSTVGNRAESLRKIMTVTAGSSGPLYLRSCAYDTYYSNTWTNLGAQCDLGWPEERLLVSKGRITVSTQKSLEMVVFPYYPGGDTLDNVTRGISNYTGKKEYSYIWGRLVEDYAAYEDTNAKLPTTMTQLPTVTYHWTQEVLPEILGDADTVYKKAQAVAEFVSRSAKYSLTPGKMASDAADFAQWFVEDSDEGYCVHFATAAAVLLRGAGIPARYVTGYLVNVTAGEETTVYGKNAHAWVEYWLPGVGWVMLEATPAAAVQEQIAPAQTQPQDNQTQPATTTEPEETKPEKKPDRPDREEETPAESSQQRPLLWVLPVILGLAALVIVQWRLRVALRKHRRHKGNMNQRVLAAWTEAAKLSRLLGEIPDPELFDLAQKAKFSQHTMTRNDLAKCNACITEATGRLKQLPLYKRLYHSLILAIY